MTPATSSSWHFESGTLWARTQAASAHALDCGALRPIATTAEWVEQAGIRFIIRQVANLARKDEAKKEELKKEEGKKEESKKDDAKHSEAPPAVNPFLPYDPAMFVADISDTHVCLLNKYNVVENHILIVTRQFIEQETLLTYDDFAALWACLLEIDGLAFYNSGAAAGASQRHKHLQLMPLPLAITGPKVPIEAVLNEVHLNNQLGTIPALPFTHVFARLDAAHTNSVADAAIATLDLYRQALSAVGLITNKPTHSILTEVNGNTTDEPAMPKAQSALGAYNLLMTREWLLVVPRRQEMFEGIAINAVGFAGAILVRNEQQLQTLKMHGPLRVLKEVSFS